MLRPLLDPDAQGIESPLAFSRYRWRIAREILALRQNRKDRQLALSFAAVADNPPAPTRLGSNVVANPSFEEPAQADGTPPGRYSLGYPKPNEKPAGALIVTDEAAHSGRFSLKWDLSKVADPAATGRDPRWVMVNVGFDPETVKSLRGKRVKVGYWMRLGGGQTVPGLGLRQNLKEGAGEGFYYRGGVTDPAAWNHFETEGRLNPGLESMDIHTWCTVPEAELARKCFLLYRRRLAASDRGAAAVDLDAARRILHRREGPLGSQRGARDWSGQSPVPAGRSSRCRAGRTNPSLDCCRAILKPLGSSRAFTRCESQIIRALTRPKPLNGKSFWLRLRLIDQRLLECKPPSNETVSSCAVLASRRAQAAFGSGRYGIGPCS